MHQHRQMVDKDDLCAITPTRLLTVWFRASFTAPFVTNGTTRTGRDTGSATEAERTNLRQKRRACQRLRGDR